MTSPDDLPDDPSALREAVLVMRAEPEAERTRRRGLEDQNERSERLYPDQLNLALATSSRLYPLSPAGETAADGGVDGERAAGDALAGTGGDH